MDVLGFAGRHLSADLAFLTSHLSPPHTHQGRTKKQTDIFLIGAPSSYRRSLALAACERAGRKAELITLTRDTNESDLKQRREIVVATLPEEESSSSGDVLLQRRQRETVWVDSAPVRAALAGSVLILDGIEKAERNTIPTLNNLLENREMQLEDGRILVPRERYERHLLLAQQTSLVPVHDDFIVIALGLPCPPFYGNPLDPPLRSRFLAHAIGMPPMRVFARTMAAQLPSPPPSVEALKDVFVFMAAVNKQRLGGAVLPIFSYDALIRCFRLLALGGVSVSDALRRVWPGEIVAAAGGDGDSPSTSSVKVVSSMLLEKTDGSQNKERRVIAAVEYDIEFARVAFTDGSTVRCPTRAIRQVQRADFIMTPSLQKLMADMTTDHAAGLDMCLVGPSGAGKSALVRELAATLGYGRAPELLFCFEDMGARDLLQRRITREDGSTRFADSALIKAAREGSLLILDGLHRVRSDVVSAIATLLQDRRVQIDTAEGGVELLQSKPRDALREPRYKGITGIHPAFRVIALAAPPGRGRAAWLTDEIATYFSFHSFPNATQAELGAIVDGLHRHAGGGGDAAPRQKLLASSARALLTNFFSDNRALAGVGTVVGPSGLRSLLRCARSAAATSSSSPMIAMTPARQQRVRVLRAVLRMSLLGFLPPERHRALFERMRAAGAEREEIVAASNALAGGPTASADPVAVEFNAVGDCVRIGEFGIPAWAQGRRPNAPHLVPAVEYTCVAAQIPLLEELARDLLERDESNVLILGNQGIGKNRICDYLCQILRLEREYMQLHRDTTVQSITVSPSLEDGRLVYKDSALVRAAIEGRCVMIDEGDKAPVEVVVVLKGLAEDGQLALPDGRRLVRNPPATATTAEGDGRIIPIHPEFKMLVLANRPGFPFLGNDLIREMQAFSVFSFGNPDESSEFTLAQAAAPDVSPFLLRRLVRAFAELRRANDDGALAYPYSLRELLHVVRHLQGRRDAAIGDALGTVLAFDAFDPSAMEIITPLFAKHGIPLPRTLVDEGGGLATEFTGGGRAGPSSWSDALLTLRRAVSLSPTLPLPSAVKAGTFGLPPLSSSAPLALEATARGAIDVRPVPVDPPQATALRGVVWNRAERFAELYLEASLPISGGAFNGGSSRTFCLDADATSTQHSGLFGGRPRVANVLRVLSATSSGHRHDGAFASLTLWECVDPESIGADAGSVRSLEIGATRLIAPDDDSVPTVVVNGHERALGAPQVAALGKRSVVFLPSNAGSPVLALQDGLHTSSSKLSVGYVFTPGGAIAPPPPPLSRGQRPHFNRPTHTTDRSRASWCLLPTHAAQNGGAGASWFDPSHTATFFCPSQCRLAQIDLENACFREFALPTKKARSSVGPQFVVTAAASNSAVDLTLGLAGGGHALMCVTLRSADSSEAGLAGGGCCWCDSAFNVSARRIDAPSALSRPLPSAVAAATGSDDAMTTTLFQSQPAREDVFRCGSDGAIFAIPAPDTAASIPAVAVGTGATVDEDESLIIEGEEEVALEWSHARVMQFVGERAVGRWSEQDAAALRGSKTERSLPNAVIGNSIALSWRIATTAATAEESSSSSNLWLEVIDTQAGAARFINFEKSSPMTIVPWRTLSSSSSDERCFVVVGRDGRLQFVQVGEQQLRTSLSEFLELRGLSRWLPADDREKASGGGGPSALAADVIASIDASRATARDELHRRRQSRDRREIARDKDREAGGAPKHGKMDDEEHHGGNTWKGGTGGSDTAGLGGKAGPYRVDKGFDIHQLDEASKRNVSEAAAEAARAMAEQEMKNRLDELDMEEADFSQYMEIRETVRAEVRALRLVLEQAEAREKEREWRRGREGELDDTRLVEALTNDANVFKRRVDRRPRVNEPQLLPKRLSFLFDVSASMFRFNGADGRLRRSLEACVMVMEALAGFEAKFQYEIAGHDGDLSRVPLVDFGNPPSSEKERFKVVQTMVTRAQHCNSGDNTLNALREACGRVADERGGRSDARHVFAFTDANFRAYSISPKSFATIIAAAPTVHPTVFCLASMGEEASNMADAVPCVRLCMDLGDLPRMLKREFERSVAGSVVLASSL